MTTQPPEQKSPPVIASPQLPQNGNDLFSGQISKFDKSTGRGTIIAIVEHSSRPQKFLFSQSDIDGNLLAAIEKTPRAKKSTLKTSIPVTFHVGGAAIPHQSANHIAGEVRIRPEPSHPTL
jgi:hypothetical protein